MTDITTLVIPITYRCNLNCSFCFASAKYNNNYFMPKEYFYEKINHFKKFNLKQVIITGGEPLIHPDLEEIIRYSKSNNLHVQILTNGTTNNVSYYSKYVDEMTFSIDGSSNIHDTLRGKKGALEKTLSNIKKLDKDCNFSITMTVSDVNIHEIDYVYSLGLLLKAKSITINPMIDEGKNRNKLLSDKQLENIYQEIKKVYKKYWFKLPLSTSLTTTDKFVENLSVNINNLFSTIWIDKNDSYSIFPISNNSECSMEEYLQNINQELLIEYISNQYLEFPDKYVIDEYKNLKSGYLSYINTRCDI